MLSLHTVVLGSLLMQPRAPPLRSSSGRVAAVIMSTGADAAAGVTFDKLLGVGGVESSLRLHGARGESGRGLCTTRAAAKGDCLLRVPTELLITVHRSGVVKGLVGQTDATFETAGDLRNEVGEAQFKRGATWDTRLALAVFEATAGAAGPFWDAYRQLLPLPPFMATASCLPQPMLEQLHDAQLQRKASAKAGLLAELHPSLRAHAVHPATAHYESMGAPLEMIPSPLEWAYALVVSRCFTMYDGDTFAFVPFLDMCAALSKSRCGRSEALDEAPRCPYDCLWMGVRDSQSDSQWCQHSDRPAANFTSDASGFSLHALRDLDEGESVTISYDGAEYSSRRMFELYGFAPEQGCARDAELLREAFQNLADDTGGEVAEGALEPSEALLAAFGAHKDAATSSPERLAALYDTLTEPGAPSPSQLLRAVRRQRKLWPTSLEQDMSEKLELEVMAGDEGQPRIDGRLTAVLSYRLSLKKQFCLAEDVLTTLLEDGQSASDSDSET